MARGHTLYDKAWAIATDQPQKEGKLKQGTQKRKKK